MQNARVSNRSLVEYSHDKWGFDLSDNRVAHINKVSLRRDRLVGLLKWVTVADIPFLYVTSHSGQLNLLPSAGLEMSTGHCGQGAVAVPFRWEGNRSRRRTGHASKTVYGICIIRAQWPLGGKRTLHIRSSMGV